MDSQKKIVEPYYDFFNTIADNKVVKIVLWVAGSVVLIWIAGHVAKSLAESTRNFRELSNALKGID
jgi:hypothetical protein